MMEGEGGEIYEMQDFFFLYMEGGNLFFFPDG